MPSVDLNADVGESYGAYRMGADESLMPHITSANIACGFHGGDPSVMHRTVALACRHGVAIGAHPGLPDLVGFGRREMAVSADDVYHMVVYQIGALMSVAKAAGAAVRHVKPHGALYNMAARDALLAEAITRAVRDVDPTLRVVALAGSALIDAAKAAGLRAVSEAFADRQYLSDGALVPRGHANALISDPFEASARAVTMVSEHRVQAVGGETISIQPDTLCIHGDGPTAAAMAAHLRQALETAGITVGAPA
jgi:5-oxoprolinase (ATP-hydrolysing) subunit A